MSLRFQQQTAIVTGAATGIGFEIARRLAAEGAGVVLNDIDDQQAEAAASRINAEYPGRCLAMAGDAGAPDQIGAMVHCAVRQFGRLDLVVANAGITLFADFFEITPAEFRKVIDLNLQGSFFLTQAAARQMRAQKSSGRILLLSSIVGQRAYPFLSAYSITKAALSMMARSLVLELSPHGISINAIAPGATLTDRTRLEDPEYDATWSRINPNGRVGLPEDIAAAALFLLSPEASHITGQTLTVDGGWTSVGRNPEVVMNRPPDKSK